MVIAVMMLTSTALSWSASTVRMASEPSSVRMTSPPSSVRMKSPRLAPLIMMTTSSNGPAALAGFAKDRAAGLAVAGAIGFCGEAVASRMPISLSPLLYATAFGIAIGNVLRLFDPELKAMEPTAV